MKTIYSVVQSDYEAPTIHASFTNYLAACEAKEKLEVLWAQFKDDHAGFDDLYCTDEEFIKWHDFIEEKYGQLRFFLCSLDEFEVVESCVYESEEEWFNEIHPTKHV